MNRDTVRRLAEHLVETWSTDDGSDGPAPPVGRSTPSPWDLESPAGESGWTAYWPLGAQEPTEFARRRLAELANLTFVTAVGVETTLIVCFRWLADPLERRYLYPIELSNMAATDPAEEIVWVRLHELHATDYEWREHRSVEISPELSVIVPAQAREA